MDLYALPPEEFTAARDAAAKQDKSLKALKRPTVAAWVVNTLVREQAELLDQLIDLGQELADAQSGGQGAELRELTQQRHQLVQAVTDRAVALVGREVTPAVRSDVAATLEAAMADAASAEAVRSGQLVRALSYAGFGGVDLEGAVADVPRPTAQPGKKPAPKQPDTSKRVQKLEAAALEAQGALDDAVRLAERTATAYDRAEQQAAESDAAAQEREQAVQELREQLRTAEQELDTARRRHSRASKELDDLRRKAERATAAVAGAQEAADATRKALDEARRG